MIDLKRLDERIAESIEDHRANIILPVAELVAVLAELKTAREAVKFMLTTSAKLELRAERLERVLERLGSGGDLLRGNE